jgi:signal transduction histidine kinase/CheY-like chemotaxis protein
MSTLCNPNNIRNNSIRSISPYDQINRLIIKGKERALFNNFTLIPIILTEVAFCLFSIYFIIIYSNRKKDDMSNENTTYAQVIISTCFLSMGIIFFILLLYYKHNKDDNKQSMIKMFLFLLKSGLFIYFIITNSFIKTYVIDKLDQSSFTVNSKLYNIGHYFQLLGYLLYINPNILIFAIHLITIEMSIILCNIFISDSRMYIYIPELVFIFLSSFSVYYLRVCLNNLLSKFIQGDEDILFTQNYYKKILETNSSIQFLSFESKSNKINYYSHNTKQSKRKSIATTDNLTKYDLLNSSNRTLKFKRVESEFAKKFDELDIAYLKQTDIQSKSLLETILERNTENGNFELIGNFYDEMKPLNEETKSFQFQIFIRKVAFHKVNYIELLLVDMTELVKVSEMKLKIKNKNESFAKVAHEFKTPLICNSALVDNMKSFLSKGRFTEAYKVSEDIQKLSEYTFYLIDDIMQVTNVLNRKASITICCEEKNPEEDLLFVFDILNVLIKMKNSINNVESKLIISKEVMKVKIMIDSIRLRQILINLISNAVKFTKCGFIKILANVNNNSLEIKVEDSGTGMKTEILNSLFKDERVIDLDVNVKSNRHGTGEGLNVVKNLCDMLNIKISCTSKLGEGSTFIISIPIINEVQSLDNYIEYDSEIYNEVNNTKLRSVNDLEVISEKSDNKSLSYSSADSSLNKVNIKTDFEAKFAYHKANVQISASTFNNTFNMPLIKDYIIKGKSSKELSSSKLDQVVDNCHNDSRLSILTISKNKYNITSKKSNSNITQDANQNISVRGSQRESYRGSFGSLFSSYLNTNNQIIGNGKQQRISRLFSIRKSVDIGNQYDLVPYSSEAPQSLKRPVIIICDDSELIRNAIMKNFYSIGEFEKIYGIICCFDGIDALSKIIKDQGRGNLIKALFIDENMEYMGGVETVKMIRRLKEDQKIKNIICVSISANEESQDNVYDCILPKPISKTAIQECLKNLKII